ncbi:MAG: phosphoenolpyruvate--protein phosphotransferase [Deltaproteobacteria bacterium]|jgi:phosphotransferase system enzyme I (PtsI)|nr:phosphoenolpyruvate--protein phosphotransferase [Deltaproteobacteria bacterium]
MQKISIKTTAAGGIAIGEVFLFRPQVLKAQRNLISPKATGTEIGRFLDAVASAKRRIVELSEKSDIFSAHIEIVDDPFICESVKTKISQDLKNAELALEETTDEILDMFAQINDEYTRERAVDIKDVTNRIMRRLKGVSSGGLIELDKPVIVVAQNLTPSDTVSLDPSLVKGLITAEGGETSHVAIIARSLSIPAIVGLKGATEMFRNGRTIVVDALEGNIIIEPDEENITLYRQKALDYAERLKNLKAGSNLPAITLDGHRVALCANVGSIRDIQIALPYGIEGIGLFRSEFLYMEKNNFPTEDEQFAAYKTAAQICPGEVIIRTLDIGGDKSLPYHQLAAEENPFLGWRAIRQSLEMVDVFKTQLRAILRASAFGDIKIMYPMIISTEELEQANSILATAKKELDQIPLSYKADIKVGMMIETPAAVLRIDDFVRQVDFVSIGTNDLTQYVLAVDRGNPKVAGYYNEFHPAVLKAIKTIIKAAKRASIPVGMCGELAGNLKAVPILLGMGLDEFSMTAAKIPEARDLIRRLNFEEAVELSVQIDEADSLSKVQQILN